MNRLLWTLFAIALVGSVVMNFVGPSKEVEKIWDLKTFFAVYGFVGCVVIIFVSKWLGKYWLQRNEEYYEPFRAPAEVGEAGERAPAGAIASEEEGDRA